SMSLTVLVERKTQKVTALPAESLEREAGDSVLRVVEPIPPDAPTYPLSIDGPILRFEVDDTEVRFLKASDCRPAVVPAWTSAPVTDDPAARRCLHREEKPITATAGCMKTASLKNSCDAAVVAVVRTTQHLLSGELPQTTTLVIPPGVEQPLGCVWNSGAKAPAVYDLLAAPVPPKDWPPRAGTHQQPHH